MLIELAELADLPRIVELSNRAAAETTANFATAPEPVDEWTATWRNTATFHAWLVARVDGQVAGFARSGPHRSRGAYAWIVEMSVYIDPAHHGRGVGTALYGRLVPLLRAQGYVTLLAGITAGHVASERLHQRAGFVRCGTFHRAGWKFGAWHDVGYWELHLQPPDHVPSPPRPVAEVWS
ncbi:MAG TPA: GNAT family N-acetyltransferase [Kofleriaceae bacterium]|nr:GNAT family N-acetyltransferase [Kofleriaceae bacterium]